MSVVIVDYGSGNLRSAEKAFERAARNCGYRGSVSVTSDPAAIAAAERIVLPGVGAFAACMRGLEALDGAREALEEAVIDSARPFLGICVGMQLMADYGREHETSAGLGWIAGEVRRVVPEGSPLKVPHMGWNTLQGRGADHPVFDGLEGGTDVYFVHSYAYFTAEPTHVIETVEYGGPVTAAIGRDNMVGLQFHPEKSQAAGLRLIENFLTWAP